VHRNVSVKTPTSKSIAEREEPSFGRVFSSSCLNPIATFPYTDRTSARKPPEKPGRGGFLLIQRQIAFDLKFRIFVRQQP